MKSFAAGEIEPLKVANDNITNEKCLTYHRLHTMSTWYGCSGGMVAMLQEDDPGFRPVVIGMSE